MKKVLKVAGGLAGLFFAGLAGMIFLGLRQARHDVVAEVSDDIG